MRELKNITSCHFSYSEYKYILYKFTCFAWLNCSIKCNMSEKYTGYILAWSWMNLLVLKRALQRNYSLRSVSTYCIYSRYNNKIAITCCKWMRSIIEVSLLWSLIPSSANPPCCGGQSRGNLITRISSCWIICEHSYRITSVWWVFQEVHNVENVEHLYCLSASIDCTIYT